MAFNATVTPATVQWKDGKVTRTNTSPVSSASGMSTEQPALPPSQLAALLAERRAASSGYQAAQVAGREQESQLRVNAERSARDRLDQFNRITEQTMDQYGDRGLAFQPIGAGQGLRQIRNAEAQDAAESEYNLALQLATVAEQIAEARRMRDEALANLTGQEQRWRSELIRDELANFAY